MTKAFSLLVLSLLACGGAVEDLSSHEQLGSQSSALYSTFSDDFERGQTTWQREERVDGPCFTMNAGEVRAMQLEGPGGSQRALLVGSNLDRTAYSNHVIAKRPLPTAGADARLDYEAWVNIDARTGDGSFEGQFGPAMTIQRTKNIPSVGWRTMTAGVQYVANKWNRAGDWRVFTQMGGTSQPIAAWETITTGHVLTPGVWYHIALKTDFATGMYRSFSVTGPDVSFTVDLSWRPILPEIQPNQTSDALTLTLEAQNAADPQTTIVNGVCVLAPARPKYRYRVHYDNVLLHEDTTTPSPN